MSLFTELKLKGISDDPYIYELSVFAWENHQDINWSLFSWYADLLLEGASAQITNITPDPSLDNRFFNADIRVDGRGINGLGFTGDPFAKTDPERFKIAVITLQLDEEPSANNPLRISITSPQSPFNADNSLQLMTVGASKGTNFESSKRGDRSADIGQAMLLVQSPEADYQISKEGNGDRRAEFRIDINENETLTSHLVSEDSDGGRPAPHALTWERSSDRGNTWVDTGIQGETYTITREDEGNEVRISSTYIDNKGFNNLITSEAFLLPFIDDGQAQYTLQGNRTIGSTLAAIRNEDDPDGNNEPSTQFQWQRYKRNTDNTSEWTDIPYANASTYTLIDDDEGLPIRLSIHYMDGQGFNNHLLIEAGNVEFRDDGQAIFGIREFPWTNRELVATELYRDPDGQGPEPPLHQWQQLSEDGWIDLDQPTSTYTPAPNLAGEQLRIKTIYSDAENTETTVYTQPFQVKSINQIISLDSDTFLFRPLKDLKLSLLWAPDQAIIDVRGLELSLYFNSKVMQFKNITTQSQVEAPETTIIPDSTNSDNNKETDAVIQLTWPESAQTITSTGEQEFVDIVLSNIFEQLDPITGETIPTAINLLGKSSQADQPNPVDNALLYPQAFSLDVDQDGDISALEDGLMIIRYLFGSAFQGPALINKAISPRSGIIQDLFPNRDLNSLSTEEQSLAAERVSNNILEGYQSEALDVDQDGSITALGDGLMIIRYLFGSAFEGAALINKAISPESKIVDDLFPGQKFNNLSLSEQAEIAAVIGGNINALML